MPWFTDEMIKKGHFSLHAENLEVTHEMGRELGHLIGPGTIITLLGGLGSGKTSFVQGLAAGMNVPKEYYVTSPTYNIINEYPGRLQLYHIDLYRISDPMELDDIGFEEIVDGTGVVAIEWPDRLPAGWLTEQIRIEIDILDDDSRNLSFTISGVDLV